MKKKQRIFMCVFFIITIGLMTPSLNKTNNKAYGEINNKIKYELNELIKNDPTLKGALAGISVRSASSGEIVFEHLGDVRMKPASNMKLLTATAALSTLGEDYTFSTQLYTDGKIKGKTLKGSLYIKGKGDPTLLKSNFDDFAKQIKSAGITVIEGDLVGDDTWYDNVRYSIDLPWSDEQTYYGSQISALTVSPNQDFDAGTIIAEVSPSLIVGEKAIIKLIPKTEYITIKNNIRTIQNDGEITIKMLREHGKNVLSLQGEIPQHYPSQKKWIAVWEPTMYALHVFKQSLIDNGIKIKGSITTGIVPINSNLLLKHKSIPLKDLLIPFMKLSNNGHAEILVKEMGKVKKNNGTWDDGISIMESELKKFGINVDTLVIRDGSGISHVNLIPANEMTKLLFEIQKEDWFQTFLKSLPVAGESEKLVGGSLRYRLKNSNRKIMAKTGTLTTVSSLSGYLITNNGERYVFSILLNQLLDESKGKMIEDKMVSILRNSELKK